ncbi:MAG: polysaccharide deacetylase family protein [Leptolyngbyaceae cyanobacterium bins.302]|nr:polysaccharide deacetylase family protein [Leptolyngbyaceae cyanobacterium bins.302]
MKPLASLSLDLDNQWSYMKTHGDPGWESYPSYLDTVVPRVLDLLKQHGLVITFFIVGQDAVLEKNRNALQAIAANGHEIGNHSFKHEPWLHLYSEPEIEQELAMAEAAIKSATGHHPVGFRGPGFSVSDSTLQVLSRRGYAYDASTFPTFLGPLARAYYFMTSKLSREEMDDRKLLFGSFWEGLRPLHPYRWQMKDRTLIEIPVTTMPIFKLPFHVSYLLYLASFVPWLATLYFRIALWLCKLTRTQPSLLLHPLDFLGGEDVPELAFFPAMNMPARKKLALVSGFLKLYCKHFEVVPMGQHTQVIARRSKIPLVEPNFPQPA